MLLKQLSSGVSKCLCCLGEGRANDLVGSVCVCVCVRERGVAVVFSETKAQLKNVRHISHLTPNKRYLSVMIVVI